MDTPPGSAATRSAAGDVADQVARLSAVARALTGAADAEAMLTALVDEGLAGMDARGAALTLWRPDGFFDIVASHGVSKQAVDRLRPLRLGDSLPLVEAYTHAEPIWLTDAEQTHERYPMLAIDEFTGMQSSAAIPLRVGGEVVGVLGVSFSQPHVFDASERDLLCCLAELVALRLEGFSDLGGSVLASSRSDAQLPVAARRAERAATRRQRLGVAVGVVGPLVVSAVRLQLDEPGQFLPGAWYAAAIVLAAVLGGVRAVVVATILAVVGMWVVVLEPQPTSSLYDPADIAGIIGFLVAASGLGYLVARSEKERSRAAQAAATATAGINELDQVVSLASVGVVRGSGDQVSEANDAFLAMTGYSRSDLTAGKLQFPILEVGDATKSGRDSPRRAGTLGPVEVEMTDHAGLPVPVMVGGAVADATDELWVCFVVDLRERMQLERALREAEMAFATAELVAELEQAQRIARLGSWSWDSQSKMVTMSHQMSRILGLPEGVTQMPLDDVANFVHEEDRMAIDTDDLQRTGGFSAEQRVRCGDGVVRSIQLHGELVEDCGQATVRGTAQDVTDMRRTEQTLARTRSELVDSRIAHRRDLEAIEALQQAVIPETLPQLPEVEIAGCYNPAGPLVMGGDWYDVFEVDDNKLALAVGDVAGHGVQSAAVMAQLRNALRAIALDDLAPHECMAKLNRLLCRVETDFFATAVFALYDVDSHTFTWSAAGHPPPLLFSDDQAVMLDTPKSGTVLGVWPDIDYVSDEVELSEGQGIWIYTDGLVERRDASIDDGIELLMQALRTRPSALTLGELCNGMVEQLLQTTEPDDDVCQLVIRRRVTNPV